MRGDEASLRFQTNHIIYTSMKSTNNGVSFMAAVSFVLDREQIVYSDRFGWKNVSVFAQ
jgi:hypothetical protein